MADLLNLKFTFRFPVFQSKCLLGFGIVILFLDRFLKQWILSSKIYEINTGISFSYFSSSPLTYLLHLFALIFLSILYLLLNFKRDLKLHVPMLLILLGGVNNFIDRILYGGVVDYINFYFFKNNLTDVVIFISAIFLSYYLLKNKKK